MISIVRIIITSTEEGSIKRFSATGKKNETFSNREYFQHYGFTSSPKADSEGLAIVDGNTIYEIASDDRRYRISLENGEVALYTDEEDFIHFKRGNLLEVSTKGKLQANAAQEADITSPIVKINATTSCTIIAPTIQLTGAVHITGAITATGAVSAPSIATTGNIVAGGTIIDSSGNTNHHVHP